MASPVQNWGEILRTQNLSHGQPMDLVSRWLLITRASVFPMTILSGLIGGLLAAGHPDANWFYRTFMDVGEFGFGTLSSPLALGLDVPENAVLLDGLISAALPDPTCAPDGESWWGTRPLSDLAWPSAIWGRAVETKPPASSPGAPYAVSAPNQKGNISSPA